MEREREIIKLDTFEQEDIMHNRSEKYSKCSSDIINYSIHGKKYVMIIKRKYDGKLFKISFILKDSESCFSDMNHNGVFEEVFPIEKTIIAYE